MLAALVITVAGVAAVGSARVSAQTSTRVVNARDFPTIQAAIDSVKDTGGTVYAPAGVWVVPAKVRLYSYVTLFGDGMEKTVIRLADGVVDHLMSNNSVSTTSTNIGIWNLSLSGSGVGTSSCCFGLRLINVLNSTVVNVASDGFSKDGFYLGYYQQKGVYNTRLSGCRATNNGRNGIALTGGTGNIIDNCRVDNNNRVERVAGIDLEPDVGQNVSDNKVVGNGASGQNVGIQLLAFDRSQVTLANNAVCTNTASRNTSAGIYDLNGNSDIFVNNTTTDNGINFLVDSSSRIGSAYASYCQLPPLPAPPAPPTPTPTPTPQPVCTPRPTVGISAVPSGTGRLQVTVSAGAGPLSALRFGAATNALIDVPGFVTGASGNFNVSLPAGTAQTTFFVRRASPGLATTVPFVVVDGCGEWQTFVGGGPAAF